MIKVSNYNSNNSQCSSFFRMPRPTQVVMLVIFFIYVTPGFSLSVLATINMNDTSQGSHDVSFIGTVSSNPDVFHNSGLEQSFFIFPVKNESTTYSGVLTFTSSKPVQIQSLNILTINNSLETTCTIWNTIYISC